LEYVAVALRRPKADVSALAVVIQSVTAGNPFYIKEMLAACYRKKCIWFDYGEKGWVFDLDRVSKHFKRENHSDTIGNDLVSNRLEELPAASKSILAYASMLGLSFSFQLILRLLSGEFTARDPDNTPTPHSEGDCLTGLQAAIQAGIILPSDDDDIFRFAHDRYVGASASLGTYDVKLMHFIMAQILVKYYSADDKCRPITASSICESVETIRSSVTNRRPFRKCLLDLARTACESGVRSEALKLYAACIALLQDDMWDDESYEETLQLYTEAAETCIYRGQYGSAEKLLLSASSNARTAVDLAPSLILQSRLLAQQGDSTGAFEALKRCLVNLDVKVDHEPTFSTCDAEFKRLFQEIQTVDVDSLVKKATVEDSNLAAVGAVLVEATSAAFWSDTLTFYRMTLIMVDTHLSSGGFPQSGMGFLQLALIAATRHNMINFASDCGNIALALIDEWKDPFTMGRGGTVYSTFVGHLQHPLQLSIPQLENALDFAIQAGDRIATILNFGFVSNLKFFTSANLAELEVFCTYGCQDIPNWEMDTLGGTMIITTKQACRALQGKTDTRNPLGVMNDEQHDSLRYKSWLLHTVKNSDRPLMLYESIEIAPLFLYGHYASAVDLGNSCLKKINAIWSARNTRFLMFFQALSLAGSVWVRVQEQLDPIYRAQSPLLSSDINGTSLEPTLQEEVEGMANLLKYFKRRIELWQAVTDVNYLAWSKILAAQIAEMENDANGALRLWEEALAHASKHRFVFEEALASNLLGSYLLRKGSPRLAKTAFREAIALYRQMGAIGVASHIEDEHQLLLRGFSKPSTADTGIQADLGNKSHDFHVVADDEPPLNLVVSDKVHTWQEDTAFADALPRAALHMIDLTSLLKSSQVISSVLRVDQLLKTMCEIILQNCKGVASLAAIVIEESEGWVIAASGDPEEGAEAHNPSPPLRGSALIVESVVNYCGRFRETILLPDLMLDNRFTNVNTSWNARNPGSKSVLAFPICYGGENKPLLGVLYLEGPPNAFTTRNLEVLQLLVNQIGISYSNALTLKEVERVSAINRSMVEVQKKALSEAIVAESNANIAKAEALRNAKLAEEAAQAKTTFLANISHELRTPLNGVIGNSDLLFDSELEEHQIEMAESIRVSADLLLSLINDILDFSKIEAHKMELHPITFNANKMVQEVIRSIPMDKRQRIKSKDVQVVQDIILPQVLLKGDSLRLHQILGNLVNNSMKFTEKGTITIGARMELETEVAVHLTFWVEDTGIGIPTQQLHKLFKPFSQADASTARKYGGSGLGLSICKSLIESMHGKIKLESIENVGTTVSFSLTLPKADSKALVGEDQADGGIPSSSAEDSATTAFTDLSSLQSDQLRICIAEDNVINQKIALQFLQKLKFDNVDVYDNGLVAVEGIRQKAREGKPYHIVLMDVQMPLLDGYEATKLLRKDPIAGVRGILVIAVTASAVQGDKEKCLAAGMNDYLAKPVRLAVLKKKLEQYVQAP
jgi:signal transduction histidine kinase/tetratricopeptide (TPR) repeat protein